jgi:hypothetical protein
MIDTIRQQYNASFTEEKYQNFLNEITAQHNHRPPFRISETPVFVNDELKKKIFQACSDITEVISAPDFKEKTQKFILPQFETPNEGDHNLFLQYDFGICQLEDGTLVPKLIELQGFPTLYFYQDMVARMYRKHFNVPDEYSHLFNGLDSESYKDLLREVIVGNDDPKHTILLEIEPHIQPTQIDYLCTSHELGIKTLCITDLKKSGRTLYYYDDGGKKVEVRRIYNRVIFDELIGRNDLKREFYFKDEVDVKWIGHPNWFFRVSKSTLPLFGGEYVPKTYILSELDKIPEDLENYVLKPLYSFSGSGVVYNVRQENIDAIHDRSNFQLQEKVTYSPVIKSLDDMVKCEIRMIMIWKDGKTQPILVNNLARMSKGKMIGVKFNKNKTWVGGSVAFFRK